MNKTDMNLLLRYREIYKERSTRNSPMQIYIAILLITALLLSAVAINFWLNKLSLEDQVKVLNEYVTNSEVIKKMAEIDVLEENIKSLETLVSETKSINDVFDSAVRFDSEALTVLQSSRYKEINFESLSFSKGILYMNIAGTKSSDISNYVLRLGREDYFKEVSYSGYTYDPNDLLYRSTIRCTLFGGGLE